jgi:hypothetical protein
MIEVVGTFTNYFRVKIPVDSFEDIMFNKMPREESDKLIAEAIEQKYGVSPDDIFVKE